MQGNGRRTALCWHPGQEEQRQGEATSYILKKSIDFNRPLCSIKVSRTKFFFQVSAPPGGKSTIGFGEPEEASKPLLPKNSSCAAKVCD